MTFLLDQEGYIEFPQMSREYGEEFFAHVAATEKGLEELCGQDSFKSLLRSLPKEKHKSVRTGAIKEDDQYPFN